MEKKISASDIFLEKINPVFAEQGFKLLKSKKKLVKVVGGLSYEVFIKFDGRGGLTMLDWLDVFVKKGTGLQLIKKFRNVYFEDEKQKFLFPMMYSQQALNLANEMNLKALSKMPFNEKYPMVRMDKSVAIFIEFVKKEIFILF